MKAGIIICTYNRAASLDQVLNHLTRQTVPVSEVEIVIVDDGSSDNTQEVYHSHLGKIPHLKYTPTGVNRGIASARNCGFRTCAAEKVLYIDDDCVPHHDWLACMTDALEHHDIVAGALSSTEGNYLTLAHNIAIMNAFLRGKKKGYHQFLAGANMGFQRAVLGKLDGFQEGRRIACDMEIALRARQQGHLICFAADAVVVHEPNYCQLKEILRYPLNHAIETIKLRHQYSDLLKTPFILRRPNMLRLFSPFIALKKTFEIYFGNTHNLKYLKTAPVVFLLKILWCWGAASGIEGQRDIPG